MQVVGGNMFFGNSAIDIDFNSGEHIGHLEKRLCEGGQIERTGRFCFSKSIRYAYHHFLCDGIYIRKAVWSYQLGQQGFWVFYTWWVKLEMCTFNAWRQSPEIGKLRSPWKRQETLLSNSGFHTDKPVNSGLNVRINLLVVFEVTT